MNTKALGAIAACVAGLAAVLGGVSVALELPTPVEIAIIAAALLLLAVAGALVGIAGTAMRAPGHTE